MRQFSDLPGGLWLVKWIDRFASRAKAESESVEVWLEKAPTDDIGKLASLRGAAVARYLGTEPSYQQRTHRRTIRREMLAGNLPDVSIGDIHDSQGMQGSLHTAGARLRLNSPGALHDTLCGAAIAPPYEDWDGSRPFLVLNHFEYRTPGVPAAVQARGAQSEMFGDYEADAGSFAGSRCLLVEQAGIQYVIPKVVVFRAFYGCCTRLINALCNGPWEVTYRQVISDKTFKSKLTTGVGADGIWRIVFVAGINWKALGYPIALLWLDEFARARASHIYASARAQMKGLPEEYASWYMDADLPFDLARHALTLTVEGYALRPLRLDSRTRRFLVTAITGADWPMADRELHAESEISSAKGDVPGHERRPGPYGYGGPRAVEGTEKASSDQELGGDRRQSTNIFHRKPFEWTGLPEVHTQRKATSDSYTSGTKTRLGKPAKKVSAGNPGGGAGLKSAPAEVITSIRERSMQFDFLVSALGQASRDGVIGDWRMIAAPAQAHGMGIKRGELECWSLVDAERRVKPPKQSRRLGWDWVYTDSGSSADGTKRIGNPRCLLVVEVSGRGSTLTLLEVECRPSESFSLIVLGCSLAGIAPGQAEALTAAIREGKGHPGEADLAAAVPGLKAAQVHFARHKYEDELKGANKVAKGLSADFMDYVLAKAGLPRAPASR